MRISCTAWAASRQEAWAFLEAINVAKYDPEAKEIRPIADVMIYPARDSESLAITRPTGKMVTDEFGNEVPELELVPGFHFDLEFYDPPNRPGSATTLTKRPPPDGWKPEDDLFSKTYILELVQGRLGEIPGWVASAEDPIPPGYHVNNVRCFDPALISSRSHGWA